MPDKKTKIVLVNPPQEQTGSLEEVSNVIMPLGIAYIAAVLKKNEFNVEILDCVPLKISREALGEKLKKINPDILAFTATVLTITNAIKVANYLKAILPEDTVFVIGGPHFTSLPEKTLEEACFDFGILGEGEYSFLEFVKTIESGKKKFSEIKSLVWRENGNVIINERKLPIKNLDEIPYPARELFFFFYFYAPMPGGYKRLPSAHMITSRGCPYKCTFCDRSVFGNKFRARTANNVVDEIEVLVKEYGVKDIKFFDDLFTIDKKRVMRICDEILNKKIDISWSCSSRVDSVDLELLHKMKKAGCWMISYGIESGNQVVLDRIKKSITLEQSMQAIKWSKKVGIKTMALIIIGMPGETKQSIEDTISFAKKLSTDVVAFYAVMVYPGNELYEIIKKEGKLLHENFGSFSCLINSSSSKLHYVPDGLTEDYIKKSISRAYKEFYIRPSYMIRQLFSIKSMVDIKRFWRGFKAVIKI